jgi:predicted DNA-binding transcriptional regulator YafY
MRRTAVFRSRSSTLVDSENEPKIVLLVRLLNAIDEGNHSFQGLKERVAENGKAPSTRSLRRYLSILSEAGFPWYFDRAANLYRFSEGYSLKRMDLSNGELFGLVALRSLGASIGGSIGSSIDEATEKLVGTAGRGAREEVATGSSVAFRLPAIELDESGNRAFSLLSSAERASRAVRFSYRDKDGKVSQRTVEPYGFVVNGGRVYCVGFDRGRRDKRTFAVDNMGDVDVLGSTFVRPRDFRIEEFAARSISGVFTGDAAVDVRVAFASRIGKAAIAARVLPNRRIERRDDGSVEIVYRVTDVDEFVRWVLGWGAQAEILEPEVARRRAAALSREIAAKYGDPQT